MYITIISAVIILCRALQISILYFSVVFNGVRLLSFCHFELSKIQQNSPVRLIVDSNLKTISVGDDSGNRSCSILGGRFTPKFALFQCKLLVSGLIEKTPDLNLRAATLFDVVRNPGKDTKNIFLINGIFGNRKLPFKGIINRTIFSSIFPLKTLVWKFLTWQSWLTLWVIWVIKKIVVVRLTMAKYLRFLVFLFAFSPKPKPVLSFFLSSGPSGRLF